MSVRIPTARAVKAVNALLARLYPDGSPAIEFVGSIRRESPDVHDVDLLTSLPVTGEADDLYERLSRLYGDARAAVKAGLFAKPPENDDEGGRWGRVVKGLARDFKLCEISIPLPGRSPGASSEPGWDFPFDLKVELHRYTPGPAGNRGWIEMITTGPGKKNDNEMGWGEMMLYRWKQRNPGGRSEGGWPVYADGARHPVPTELDAFRACGFLEVIEPKRRTCEFAKILASARSTS